MSISEWKAEVTSNTPEFLFKHLQLTNPLWNYKQEVLWLQRGGISPGKSGSPPGHLSVDHVDQLPKREPETPASSAATFHFAESKAVGAEITFITLCWCAHLAADTQMWQFNSVSPMTPVLLQLRGVLC